MDIIGYRCKNEREWDYPYADKPEETIAILDCIVKVEAIYAGVE